MFVKLCHADPGSPFQLAVFDPAGSGVIPLDNSVLSIPLGRPALVGIDRGRGPLQTVAPSCEVICKSV